MSKQENQQKIAEVAAEVADTDLLDDLPSPVQYLSTGCTQLDLAISNILPGGFPVGRTVEIMGAASTSKTVLGMLAIGSCQRAGGVGYFVDVEDTFLPSWANMFGIDIANKDTFRLFGGLKAPSTIEAFYDDFLAGVIEESKKDKRNKIIVVDSLTPLAAKDEVDRKLDEGSYKTQKAKQMSAAFRKYNPIVLSKNNISIVYINQTRDNVDTRGPKETTSGGRALEFYTSVRIYLKVSSKIENSAAKKIGVWIKFEVTKNKVAPPFRDGMYRILFDYGLDDIFSNLQFLKDNGYADGEKKVKFAGENKMISTMVKHVEANNLEEQLKQEVAKVWKEVYKTETGRKQRIWI